jgi:hypothetical protein
LTLLAGANSSGKSSVMQGPLLLKQTLEAQYDPGALLLDGPHVRFTAIEQMLPRSGDKLLAQSFSFAIRISDGGMRSCSSGCKRWSQRESCPAISSRSTGSLRTDVA